MTVAAIAGLLVLLFQGSAAAAEPSSSELARVLARRDPLSAGERLATAQSILRAERHSHYRGLASALADTGWSAWQRLSPRGALRSARQIVSEVRGLFARSGAEAQVLDLLEPARHSGRASAELEDLYDSLLAREREAQLEELLRGAEAALDAGYVDLARIRATRSSELAPESLRAAALLERLQTAESRPIPDPAPLAPVGSWEADIGAALLLGDYRRAGLTA